LIAEIGRHAGSGLVFDTVYFGGGTPSRLAPADLERILAALGRDLDLEAGATILLEANPEDVSEASLRAWLALGIRTLSLGVQAFDTPALSFLGRRHDAARSHRAVELALAAGFPTVSVDLIYGLPDQTPAQWRRELERVVELGAPHVSCYQLTVHPRTVFGLRRERGQLTELGETAQAELFLLTHTFLGERGYEGYEVSNFARSAEHRSPHNLKYWNHTPYLGLGPSAHSFRGARRWWNVRRLADWEERLAAGGDPVEAEEHLGPEQLALESLMLGLRTRAGVDLAAIRSRFGIDLAASHGALIDALCAEGLLTRRGASIAPTLGGMAVADGLAARFDPLTRSPEPQR
jgi:oxygen-independent coproporphyrinogen-3 oxidase